MRTERVFCCLCEYIGRSLYRPTVSDLFLLIQHWGMIIVKLLSGLGELHHIILCSGTGLSLKSGGCGIQWLKLSLISTLLMSRVISGTCPGYLVAFPSPTLGVWMCSGHVPGDLKGPRVPVDIVGYTSVTDILSLNSSEDTKKSFNISTFSCRVRCVRHGLTPATLPFPDLITTVCIPSPPEVWVWKWHQSVSSEVFTENLPVSLALICSFGDRSRSAWMLEVIYCDRFLFDRLLSRGVPIHYLVH